MKADRGEYIGPPVASGDEQQDAKQNSLRGKKEGNLAIRETKQPCYLRGNVVADSARKDIAHRAEQRTYIGSSVYRNRDFAICQMITRSIDKFRTFFLLCHAYIALLGSPRL